MQGGMFERHDCLQCQALHEILLINEERSIRGSNSYKLDKNLVFLREKRESPAPFIGLCRHLSPSFKMALKDGERKRAVHLELAHQNTRRACARCGYDRTDGAM